MIVASCIATILCQWSLHWCSLNQLLLEAKHDEHRLLIIFKSNTAGLDGREGVCYGCIVIVHTWQDIKVTIFAEVALHVCLSVVWLWVAWGHLSNELYRGKNLWHQYWRNFCIYIKLLAVSSFSIFGFVESTDDNPQVRSSDLCISTQYQLIQCIMDEVVLGLYIIDTGGKFNLQTSKLYTMSTCVQQSQLKVQL